MTPKIYVVDLSEEVGVLGRAAASGELAKGVVVVRVGEGAGLVGQVVARIPAARGLSPPPRLNRHAKPSPS